MSSAFTVISYAWLSFGVVWLVSAAFTKRTIQKQSVNSRLVQLTLAIVAALLLMHHGIRGGILDWNFVPDSLATAYTGMAVTLAGIAFAIWARFHIGKNWSGVVTVKQGHELVRTGPYAIVRHPIYSGVLLGLLGTAIAGTELRGLIAVAIAAFMWRLKYGIEESFMIQQFGEEYVQYRREVKATIPFVW